MYKHIIFYFLLSNSLIFSAYLRDVPQKIKQPDGSILECFSSGDEFYNWVHDENGYTIVRSQVDGYCYYANEDLTPSKIYALLYMVHTMKTIYSLNNIYLH